MGKILFMLKALLNDKRGEELCTHMYTPLERFFARMRVKKALKDFGYSLERCICWNEHLIIDREDNLVGVLRAVRHNKDNIEPTVFLMPEFYASPLKEKIAKAGCSVESKELNPDNCFF